MTARELIIDLVKAEMREINHFSLGGKSPERQREYDLLAEWLAAAERVPVQPSPRKIDGKFSTRGQIFNTVSGEEIPEDEPLFLLRARDHNAYDTLMHYLSLCLSECNDLHLEGIRQTVRKFIEFRNSNPSRMKQPGITKHLKLEALAEAGSIPQHQTDRLLETVRWIAGQTGQTDLFFAECSQAEEIVARCKEALAVNMGQPQQEKENAG